jgi:putative salt-induced outer membrane protein YdiY
MPRFLLRSLLVLFLLTVCASVASADEVRLRNGDRYTGKVVELVAGRLKFDTGHGTVTVAWGDVEMLDIADALLVTVRNSPPRLASLRSVAGGGLVLEPYDVVVSMQDLVALAHPQQFHVGGDANAGLQASGGNTDVHSLIVNGELVAQGMGNRYTLGASVNHASTAGAVTNDNATGSLRYDRFFNPRLYANANVLMTHDQFRDLRLRTALGSALGYQVFNGTRVKLRTELGYGYVNETFATETEQGDRYHAARDTVRLDVNIIGTRFSVFHQHDGFFGLIGSNRLFVQTRNGLRMVLMGGVVATIEYDLDYDRSALPGRKRTDHTAALTFGYRFGMP